MSSSKSPPYWLVIEPYWEKISIYDGPEQFLREFRAAPVNVQHLFAAHWLQSEVMNGGFGQFFDNSTGVLAPEAVDAFETIGMPHSAAFIRHLLTGFGDVYPRDRETRCDALDALYDETEGSKNILPSNPLQTYLDDEFFSLIETEGGGFLARANQYAESVK